MSDILLVDDDSELLQSLVRALSPLVAPLKLIAATSAAVAQSTFTKHRPRVVVLDLCIDERQGVESGFQLLSQLHAIDPTTRCIVLTGHGSVSHGVEALSRGASSFLEKPTEPNHLAAIIADAASQAGLRRELERVSAQLRESNTHELRGRSEHVVSLREQLAFVASNRLPVLLLGETGTGKGLCARIIHECSPHRSGRFVHYQPNFGGGDIVQSELFGHVRGAYTGAVDMRQGLALQAHRGTLFLDELDEIPLAVQVRLLDLVQEKRVRAVGADQFSAIECKCIAATNRPIEEALETGKIRRDLYHRLAHATIRLPPLRERLEDIPDICQAALQSLCKRENMNVFDVAPEVFDHLTTQRWPGNIRELQATVEAAAYKAHFYGRDTIEVQDLGSVSAVPRDVKSGTLHDHVENLKVRLVQEALREHNGNQVHAARALGLDRGTLRRLMARSA
jgi:DNA-binding NtrC family response regulator